LQKILTENESRDPKLDVEIMSQKITLSSEFIKNNVIEKYVYDCKFLTVRKNNKYKSKIRFWP